MMMSLVGGAGTALCANHAYQRHASVARKEMNVIAFLTARQAPKGEIYLH